jgi:hypothetical protein
MEIILSNIRPTKAKHHRAPGYQKKDLTFIEDLYKRNDTFSKDARGFLDLAARRYATATWKINNKQTEI